MSLDYDWGSTELFPKYREAREKREAYVRDTPNDDPKKKETTATLVQQEDDLWYTMQSVVFISIPVGIYRITEKNWEEFYIRAHAWEIVKGPMRRTADGEGYITPAEVHSLIGLSTNVSERTTAAFKTLLWEQMKDEAAYGLSRYRKEQENADQS